MFVWNALLALVWAALNGEISLFNLLVGFALSYILLWITHRAFGRSRYFHKVPQIAKLLLIFLWDLLLANLRVAYDVLTPTHHMRPGVVGIPLDAKTDLEITLFANMVTLTPGTLSLDVSEDRKTLFLHAAYIDVEGVEPLRRRLKDGLERRLLEVLR